jgi:heme/copper-type cytochrome/quinol oxidase subunit 2
MDVPGYVWLLTVIGIVAMLALDFVFHVRKAHSPTLKEAAVWSSIYVGIAIFLLVEGTLIWSLVRYRSRRRWPGPTPAAFTFRDPFPEPAGASR